MEDNDLKNPVWKDLVLKKKPIILTFFPGKILLSRCQLAVSRDNSPEAVDQAINEVFQLYLKYKDLPNAKKDISLILNK